MPIGTPWPAPAPVIHWQAQVSRSVAGEPVRLILSYQPYLSAPVANEITFTATCDNCAPTGPSASVQPPLTMQGRLLLTPEFCSSNSTQPNPLGQICWSGPVVFPSVGTWHITSPFDVDVQIEPPAGLSVSNGTTLTITIVVNGRPIGTVVNGRVEHIPQARLPGYPWTVEARTPTGRLVASLSVNPGDVLRTTAPFGGVAYQGAGVRVDLSCGRLDIWSGPSLLGPSPAPGSPGDCTP